MHHDEYEDAKQRHKAYWTSRQIPQAYSSTHLWLERMTAMAVSSIDHGRQPRLDLELKTALTHSGSIATLVPWHHVLWTQVLHTTQTVHHYPLVESSAQLKITSTLTFGLQAADTTNKLAHQFRCYRLLTLRPWWLRPSWPDKQIRQTL